MSDFTDLLTRTALDKAKENGLQVYVKANFLPRLKVYDASAQSGGGADFSFLKAGVEVKNNQGETVMNYGAMPETDYILTGALVAIAGAMVFFIIRGIVK